MIEREWMSGSNDSRLFPQLKSVGGWWHVDVGCVLLMSYQIGITNPDPTTPTLSAGWLLLVVLWREEVHRPTRSLGKDISRAKDIPL
jgi:hypothetical protein